MQLTDQDLIQLEREIDHILDSGANSLRIVNMFKSFTEQKNRSFGNLSKIVRVNYDLSNYSEVSITSEGTLNVHTIVGSMPVIRLKTDENEVRIIQYKGRKPTLVELIPFK